MKDFRPSGKKINRKEALDLKDQGLKWCAKCETCLGIHLFSKGQSKCKACCKKLVDDWKSRNDNYFVQYRKNNQEPRKLYNQKWRKENKDHYLNTKHEWRAKQRKENPSYNILNSLRSRLNWCLKNERKISPTLELLGCSLEQLKLHLESQFQKGMNWDNYGNPNGDHSSCWHIDHKIPCSSFDFSNPEQQKQCFNYTNLQPLWGMDNIMKSDKL